MKRFFATLFLLTLLSPILLKADEIVIGTETMKDHELPFQTFYPYSWVELIYPGTSLNSACIINSIAFDCATAYEQTFTSMEIYIGVTDRLYHNSTTNWTPENDLQLVYSATNVTIAAQTGWQTFTLTEPFVYEGEGNLVIAIGKKGIGKINSGKWNVSNATYGAALVCGSDNDQGAASYPTGAGSQYSTLPNITLNITPTVITCRKVVDVHQESTTALSATIGWTPYEGTSAWDVFVSQTVVPGGNTTPTATNITGTTYTFTGLHPGQTYHCYVRSNCGDGDVSAWRPCIVSTDPDIIGTGTEEDPYLIYYLGNLQALSEAVNKGWQTQGKYFKVMNDIEGVTTPIGSPSKRFEGNFDGNGHTIDINLTGAGYQALFAQLGAGANIHDITVTGNVTCTSSYGAGLVGYITISSPAAAPDIYITNCVNKADVFSNSIYIGGIVGYYYGNVNTNAAKLFVTGCVNRGSITGNAAYHAGIIGEMQNSCTLNGCVNYGTIDAGNYTGGVASRSYKRCLVINCANKGSVKGKGSTGGVIGYNYDANIYNCYNTGDIIGGGSYVGGVIGYSASNTRTGYGIIENVYNAGHVTNSNTNATGSIVGQYKSSAAKQGRLNYAFYEDGTHANAYGPSSNNHNITNVAKFTQDATTPTVFILSQAVGGTTDLLTALNAWRNNNEQYTEWLEDEYGNNRNHPTFEVGNEPGLEIVPNPIDLVERPIGVHMHGYPVKLVNTSDLLLNISNMDFTGNFFVLDEENPSVPFTLAGDAEQNVIINTNADATVDPGVIAEHFVVNWNGDRTSKIVDISTLAYTPSVPDVVELPGILSATPQTVTQPTANIHDNYYLPGNNIDSRDAVYKLTFDHDVNLNVSMTEGSSPKMALYRENLEGEAYPDVDNYYQGPYVNIGGNGGSYLFDQADMITNPGAGFGGADVSAIIPGGSTYGVNADCSVGYGEYYWVADDFVCSNSATINTMEFYAIQSGISTESQMTGLYVKIYDSNPADGGEVIWGDSQTNLLTSTEWTGIYRTGPNVSNYQDNSHPIMKLVATGLDINLFPGTYWIEVGFTGAVTPYANPRTVVGQNATGNAWVKTGLGWREIKDTATGAKQGLPMILKSDGRCQFTPYAGAAAPEYGKGCSDLYLSFDNPQPTQMREEEYPISYGGDEDITNVTVTPGTYYLVASSTSVQFALDINPEIIPLPLAPTCIHPYMAQRQVDPAYVNLKWNFGQFTTEYQVLVGTTNPPTEVVQDWTSNLSTHCLIENLNSNTNYFWQVNERNSSGTTTGPVWLFTTTISVPQQLTVEDSKIMEGENAVLHWQAGRDRTFRGYNVYQDGVKINDELVTETTYSVSDLTYNMYPGYTFNVTSVYDEGESDFSNDVVVRVSGYGIVSGHVWEQDETTPIEGVTVLFAGVNEFNEEFMTTFTTDANGEYSGELPVGYCASSASAPGYQTVIYFNHSIRMNYNEETPNIDYVLYEEFIPVGQVIATEISDDVVRVDWSRSIDPGRVLNHYNVYRTDCYNEDPSLNYPTLLASEITSNTYMDVEWSDVESGVYKWGVAAVYAGNRNEAQTQANDKWIVPDVDHSICMPAPNAVNNGAVGKFDSMPLRGRRAYACSLQSGTAVPYGYISYTVDNPTDAALVYSPFFMYSGEFYDGILYTYDPSGIFIKVDAETGVMLGYNQVGYYFGDMAYDYSTHTMYGMYGSNLGTIDLATGYATMVGSMGHTMLTLSCDFGGQLYAIEAQTGDLYRVDKQTAQVTLVGSTGINCRYLQSADIDRNTGNLYWAGYADNRGFFAQVSVVDATTTIIAENVGEQSCFYIPYDATPGESEITWSNCLDKNMETELDVVVLTNTTDPVTGTVVTLTNISEPNLNLVYETTFDESGAYQWADFRKGDYVVNMALDGYVSCFNNDTIQIYGDTTLRCVLVEILKPIDNLYVSPTGWATWSVPVEHPTVGDEFYYDFDDGGLANLTYIDADGDGRNWTNSSLLFSGYGHNNSYYYITSQSYDNSAGALTPDNYMVSKLVEIGPESKFSFWACAQDANYPAEHFGVGISTTSNTDPNAFVMIADWTLTAKGGTGHGGVRGTTELGQWYEYEVDLSEYAGQQVYIAIRHYESSDNYYLNIDDMKLYVGDGRDSRHLERYKVLIDGQFEANVTDGYCQHDVTNLIEGQQYSTSVCAIYSTGQSEWLAYDWTYKPCDYFEGMQNFEAEVNDEDVVLTWSGLPQGKSTREVLLDQSEMITNEGAGYAGHDVSSLLGTHSAYGAHAGWLSNGNFNFWVGDDVNFTSDAVIDEIEVFAFQDCFDYPPVSPMVELYIKIYDGNPMEGGQVIWGDETTNLMTSTEWTGIFRTEELFMGDNSRPIMSIVASGLNIELPAGKYWITYHIAGDDVLMGPYAIPRTIPGEDKTGNAIQLNQVGWHNLYDSGVGQPFGMAMKVNGTGGSMSDNILGVMVFRDGVCLTPTPLTTSTYIDVNPGHGTHDYCARVVYGGEPDVTFYAMSCPMCAHVEVVGVDENNINAVLYPNPTKGNVTIEAAGMNHVTVVSALGQVIYDNEVHNDVTTLNMAQFKAGVYVVRIATENGVSTQRVTVVK